MATIYTMRALHIPTSKYVSWTSVGSADMTGDQSAYDPSDLSGIVVDYTSVQDLVPITNDAPQFEIAGDLDGLLPDPIVIALQGYPIQDVVPEDGYVLTWVDADGYWEPKPGGSGSGVPGGSDTQVQINDAGTFGGDAGFTYNKTTNVLSVSDAIAIGSSVAPTGNLRVAGGFSIKSNVGGVTRPVLEATVGAEVLIGGFGSNECGGIIHRVSSGAIYNQILGNNHLTVTSTSVSIAPDGAGVALSIGQNPATDGTIRLIDNSSIKGRNSGNTANHDLLTWNAGALTIGNADASSTTVVGNIGVGIRGDSITLSNTNNTEDFARFTADGVQFGSANMDLGSGNGVIGIDNATTNPSTNPTNGIIAYVDAGDGYFKYRKADGTTITLSGGGGGTPGGSDTQIQFNDGGVFGGDAGFTYNKTTDALSLVGQLNLGNNVQFLSTVATPTISQANETGNSVNGDNLIIQAQNSTGTTTIGGNLVLRPGSGTTSHGSIRMFDPGTGSNAIDFIPRSAGASTITFVAGTTGVTVSQTGSTSGNGATLQITSQATSNDGSTGGILGMSAGNATGTNGTGGAVNVSAGSGNTANGSINFRTGTTTFFTFLSPNPAGTVNAQFVSGITTLNLLQANNSTNGATGAPFKVQAQNATGTTSTGGNLLLTSGTGTTIAGQVKLQTGGTDRITVAATGVQIGSGALDLGGGIGVIGIDNAGTNPSTNPTSGIIAYVDAGDGYLKYRKADGTTISLSGGGAGGSPGGSDTYIQFNDGGTFGGDAGLTYNKTANSLKIDTGYLQINSTETGDAIHIGNNQWLVGQRAAGGKVYLISANSSNEVIVGTSANPSVINVVAGTGFAANIYSGTTHSAEFGDSLVRIRAGAIAVGATNTASGGAIRLQNNSGVHARNAANSADVQLAYVTALDELIYGNANATNNYYLSGTHNFQTAAGASMVSMNSFGMTVHGGTIVLGDSGTAAATGEIRMQNNSTIKARNAADTADVYIAQIDTVNQTWFGDATSGTGTVVRGSTVYITDHAGSQRALLGGVNTDFIQFGAAPATGTATDRPIRLSNNTFITMRNAANNGNIFVVGANASNQVILSSTGGAGTFVQSGDWVAHSSPTNYFQTTGGVTYAEINATYLSLPLGGNVSSTGTVRLPYDASIRARNSSNDADLNIFRFDGGSLVEYSDPNIGTELLGNAIYLSSDDINLSSYMRLEGGVLSTFGLNRTVEYTSDLETAVTTWNKRVDTADATVTDIHTWTIFDEAVSLVDVSVVAIKTDGSAGASYKRSITFRRTGGTVSTIGSVHDNQTDETASTWDVTVDNNTSTGRVRVTGAAATDIIWHATIRVQSVLVI